MNNLTPEGPSLSDLLEMQVKETLPRRGSRKEVLPPHNRIRFFDLPLQQAHTYYVQDVSQRVAIKLVFYPTEAPQVSIGLTEFLTGHVGISDYFSAASVPSEYPLPRAQLYRKSGILVGHSGRKISAEDVANALAEE